MSNKTNGGYTDKFPIGFWNYTRTGDLKPECVKDWHDLGMTTAMSPGFNCEKHDKSIMLAILDECEKYGIKVIICDSRVGWTDASSDPEGYEAKFRAAYADFGSHPATLGFHIGDEPINEKDFNDCISAYKIQLRVAPKLMPFVNFLPYWPGIEQSILKRDSFEDWAIHMAKDGELKLLCYDHYAQLNPEEAGTDAYYTNLYKFSAAAAAADIPVWTTLLSVGHFRYRQPSEDDFRWQLNTAAACGCKGILWFFIYMRAPKANYRVAPIDEFWEKTESFDRLSRVNKRFGKQYGDFFLNARLLKTRMTGKAYGGYSLLEPNDSELINGVTCDQNLPAVVSFFEKDGEKYICVVNNSPFESGMFKVHASKALTSFKRLGWNGLTEFRDDHWDAFYDEGGSEIICGDWYAPGQMQVYKFN